MDSRMTVLTLLVVGLFAFIVWILIFFRSVPAVRQCKKNPTLVCPYTVTVTARGSFSATGHGKCCAFMDKMKAMNAAFCEMEPNKNYNGMSITPEFKQRCVERQERYNNMNTDGPLE